MAQHNQGPLPNFRDVRALSDTAGIELSLGNQVTPVESAILRIDTRLTSLEDQVTTWGEQVTGSENLITGLRERFTALEEQITILKNQLIASDARAANDKIKTINKSRWDADHYAAHLNPLLSLRTRQPIPDCPQTVAAIYQCSSARIAEIFEALKTPAPQGQLREMRDKLFYEFI